jgi:hypothetical protein
MTVERDRGRILGVDDHRVRGEFRTDRTRQSVHQQRCAEPFSLMRMTDRESSQTYGGDKRIARQTTSQSGIQFVEWYAAGTDGVVACHLSRRAFECDKASRQSSADVLCDTSVEITVERLDAADEPRPLVRGRERFDDIGVTQTGPTRRRWRSMARSIAGVRGDGSSNASAKRCWSMSDRRMISVSSMVRRAASRAAETTKSDNVRPSISAARFSIACTSCGRRASSRAVRDIVAI